MNRRTFIKVLLGTVATLATDPIKVLAEQAPKPYKRRTVITYIFPGGDKPHNWGTHWTMNAEL